MSIYGQVNKNITNSRDNNQSFIQENSQNYRRGYDNYSRNSNNNNSRENYYNTENNNRNYNARNYNNTSNYNNSNNYRDDNNNNFRGGYNNNFRGGYNNNFRGNNNTQRNFPKSKEAINAIIDIKYLFINNNIDMKKFSYKILEFTSDLVQLDDTYKYITPIYTGENYIFIFFKNCNKYISILIKKKDIYKLKNEDINKLNILNKKVYLGENIYKGTILEGTLLNTNNEFVINDVYMLCGEQMIDKLYYSKIMNISSYINNNYSKTDNRNELKLYVNSVFDIKEFKNMIDNKNIENKKYMKGIAFNKKISDTRLLYFLNNEVKGIDIADKKIPGLNYKSNLNNNKNSENIFMMKKTEMYDVYNLLEKDNNGEYTINIGIAYLPNVDSSKYWGEVFNNKSKTLVKCIFNQNKNKWTPIDNLEK